jgi:beta-glucanase (GH16 family)
MDVAGLSVRPAGSLAYLCALAGALLGVVVPGHHTAAAATATGPTWVIAWQDQFTGARGTLPGATNWVIDLGHGYGAGAAVNWGTGEVETATAKPDNVSLDGSGNLRMTATRDGAGNWFSSRIETRRSDSAPPKGGSLRFEARLKLPAGGPGYWPAFWALGAPFRPSNAVWPSVGEIDVMETINSQSTVHGTLHCGTVGTGGPCHEDTGLTSATTVAGATSGFHTYAVVWNTTPQSLQFFVDDRLYGTVTPTRTGAATWAAAFGHGYFLLLDLAVGGGWPGAPNARTIPNQAMLVDYVRVSTRAGR